MGIGNYYLSNARTVYVFHEEVYGGWNSDLQQFNHIKHMDDFSFHYEGFLEHVLSILPSSYERLSNDKRRFNQDDHRVTIAENGHYEISVIDWGGLYFAINIELKESNLCGKKGQSLARHHHDATATRLFDAMIKAGYKLYVRVSGWTSTRYWPSMPLPKAA